jgi:LuxR family maltose regulon positive regulatory protein
LSNSWLSETPKIMRPRLHGVIARDRLFDKLTSGGAPVAWISAAPGAGKTTLAASYSQSLDANVIWYQVDASDADPATFFYFMRQAAAKGGVAKAARLPLLPPESAADFAVFAKKYFSTLFSLLSRRTIFVIDNFQEANDPAFETIMRVAFELVPERVAVIVLSLSTPPPALARLVANGVINLVAADELRFTREESDEVALAKLTADKATLAELHERSAGWAAGLVLMIEHMRAAGAHTVPSLDESHEAVFDYFAGEVLATFSPVEQRALMMTASLPRVTARLAQAMSGLPDADRLLDHLHRRHLFVDRRSASELSYQYHRLFKAFLLNRAQKSFSAAERLDAAEQAALLLDVAGDFEDAISMYLAAANWDAATRLILQEARRLYEQGRTRTLIEWVMALPVEIVDAKPWLAYWLGACQVWTSPSAARPVLERASRQFAVVGDVGGRVLAAGVLSRVCILDADWNALDGWISELETLLSADTAALAPDILLTGYSRLIYAAFARYPQHPRLSTWADRTSTLLDQAVEPSDALLAAFSLLTYLTWTGQTANSEQLVRQIEPLTSDGRLSPVSLVYWMWTCSNHLLRVSDPQEALALIDRALELAASNGLTIAGVIRRHRITHLLTLGRLAEAELELNRLATAKRVEPYFELRAWLALQQGDVARALDEAQVALRQAKDRGRSFYQMLDFFLLAVICAAAGSHDQARGHLQSYREATLGMAGELAEFQASLVEAYLALREGLREDCHVSLRRALEIGSRQRYRSCWGWEPVMVTRLLTEALDHGICVAYCRDLIRTHRLAPETADVEHWPWPVRVRTLGRFEVQIDGRPLRFEGKAQRKPLELLKMLIASGEGAVAIEHLIDLLWEPSEQGGRKALDITVHRLRKLLGLDATVEVADRQVRLDSRFVWVDAWALERVLNACDSIARPSASEDLEAAAPRILNLFGGVFLAGDAESPWHLGPRNRLTGRFQRFAERLGSHFERTQRWDLAGTLYQRVTELDPLAEAFYRRQMVCLREQGRRAEAIEAFRRCRHILSVTLSVVPAPETQALFHELSAG